jgi:hypothetical protein
VAEKNGACETSTARAVISFMVTQRCDQLPVVYEKILVVLQSEKKTNAVHTHARLSGDDGLRGTVLLRDDRDDHQNSQVPAETEEGNQ